jgi:membrane protein
VGFALGLVVRQRGVDAILGPALETAPDVAEAIARRELERLAGASAAPIAPLSILGFMWLAATGTHGLMDVFESAVAAPPRPWWKQRVMALAWVAGGLVVVAALGWAMIKADVVLRHYTHASPPTAASAAPSSSVAAAPALPAHAPPAATATKTHSHRHLLPPLLSEAWERLGALALLSFFAVAGLAGFYRFAVEHPPGVRRRVWSGALVAFATWLFVSWGFGVYVSTLASYTLYYGGLAAVAVLIVWLYLTSWALLLGVEVNAQLEGLRSAGKSGAPDALPAHAHEPERR